MAKLFLACFVFLIFQVPYAVGANEEDEIAFEETTEQNTQDCNNHRCRHYHVPRYNPEEEKLLYERNDSEWPGKRDDPIYDQVTHY